MSTLTELILGGGPAAMSISARRLEAGAKVHLVAEWLPNGTHLDYAKAPAYTNAAGIQQPFGGGDPADPRLRLYMESHPVMMERTTDTRWRAIRRCELRTLIDPSSRLPPWANLVEDYRREGDQEIYQTAAFDPAGLVRCEFESLQRRYGELFTFECRSLTAEERSAVCEQRSVSGYARTHACIGLSGFSEVINDGTDFPILGVLIHLKGDGKTICWMDESRPAGMSGGLEEPDCLYVIRRPEYLGDGICSEEGRVVLGGTIKPHVAFLSPEHLGSVVNSIFAGCEARFGETFDRRDILQITSGQRPGNENGFEVFVSPDGTFSRIRGQAGMGLVTAYGCGMEVNRLITKRGAA